MKIIITLIFTFMLVLNSIANAKVCPTQDFKKNLLEYQNNSVSVSDLNNNIREQLKEGRSKKIKTSFQITLNQMNNLLLEKNRK